VINYIVCFSLGVIIGLLIGILRRLEDIYQLLHLWYETREREYESNN